MMTEPCPISCRHLGTLVLLLLALALAACAPQRLRDEARAQAQAGQYDQARQTLQAGLKDHPESALLRASLVQLETDAVAQLVAQAGTARASGQPAIAEKLLQQALALQPGNVRVESLLAELAVEQRQRAALAEAQALASQGRAPQALRVLAEALKANPRQGELLALQRQLELAQRQAQVQAAQLGLSETRPISLDFRDASLRTVLDVVSRNSGVNFVLDKDIRSDTRVTVFLKSARVEDAIDLITSTYGLAKKVVDSQTLLIYPNTPEKLREHQEQVVKVFHLAGADAKAAAAFLRSMLRIKEPFVDERSNLVALREPQETIQLAERLMAMFDTAEPEVLLEVEVIEVRTSRLTELGVKLPNTFSLTPLAPAGQSGLTLDNIRDIGRDRIGFAIGGVTVNLRRETGDFNTLANPRIRVKNREKAKILIGDKVPVVSAVTGPNNFISDNISYLDVGLKLDVEPVVFVDDEVSMKVALEVSTLGSPVRTASGSLAYQIGTRNAATQLRLRDGETQLLAGLISRDERSSANRLPGLGDLPVLGRLFSSTLDDNSRTELVLSITPRVLRNARRLDVNESELWVGTETQPRMRPVGGVRVPVVEAAGPTAAGAAQTPQQATPGPASTQSAARPAPVPTVLRFDGPAQAKASEVFEVTLMLQTGESIRGGPLELAYSRERLQLLEVQEGEFYQRDGMATSFSHVIDQARGRASAGMLRNTASGASGEGRVLTLKFKALSAGPADLKLTSFKPVGEQLLLDPPSVLPSLTIQVQ